MTDNLPAQFILLQLPLLRHLHIKRMVDTSIELIDLHSVQPMMQPIIFSPQTHNCRLVFLQLIGMAFAKRLRDPGQHFVAKSKAAENFREFFSEDLLPHIRLVTLLRQAFPHN